MAHPSAVFTVEDLAIAAYPGINRVEKKHRVAVLRAAYKAFAGIGWSSYACERPGGHILFYNPLNLRSYARARILADFSWWRCTLDEVDAMLDNRDGWPTKWDLVQPGGAWAIHVEINKAKAAGNAEEAARLRAALEASVAATLARGDM
jgi:hypothetical protein